MSKQAIAIVMAIVVVAGGGYFAYTKMNKETGVPLTNPAMENGTSANVETTKPGTKKIPFSSLMAQGGSYVCNVHQNVNNVDSIGTVYMTSGKLRGEFKTAVAGMNINTTFVIKDGYSYMWSSAMPNVGYKIAVIQKSGDTSAPGVSSYSFNGDQIGDYDCKEWAPNEAMFALSTGIKFTEIKK